MKNFTLLIIFYFSIQSSLLASECTPEKVLSALKPVLPQSVSSLASNDKSYIDFWYSVPYQPEISNSLENLLNEKIDILNLQCKFSYSKSYSDLYLVAAIFDSVSDGRLDPLNNPEHNKSTIGVNYNLKLHIQPLDSNGNLENESQLIL